MYRKVAKMVECSYILFTYLPLMLFFFFLEIKLLFLLNFFYLFIIYTAGSY